MNIIRLRRQERESKIYEIIKAIERVKIPNYPKLLLAFSAKWGISMRTMKEYMEIAKYKCSKK